MKIKAPNLTSGKRATLERTKEWLVTLVEELAAKKARLDKLTASFEEAESRKHQFERDAAVNPDAALNLAGAKAQLSQLQREINDLTESLSRETATAIRQSNLVRSGELRDLLFGPLLEQLQAAIAAAISPFFPADWAKQYARQLMTVESCDLFRQISIFLSRSASITDNFDDAKREIEMLIGDLAKILAGETLIEA